MSALREAAEAAAAYFAEQLSRQPHLTKATQIHSKLVAALNVRPYAPITDGPPIAPEAVGKTCTRCWVKKSHQRFSRSRSTPDGYQAMCKLCAKADQTRRSGQRRDGPLDASSAAVARLQRQREGQAVADDRAPERRL